MTVWTWCELPQMTTGDQQQSFHHQAVFHGQSTTSTFIACKLLLYESVMMLQAWYSSSYNMPALIRKSSAGVWSCRLIKFHKGPLFISISIIWHCVNWDASLCLLSRKGIFFFPAHSSSFGLKPCIPHYWLYLFTFSMDSKFHTFSFSLLVCILNCILFLWTLSIVF